LSLDHGNPALPVNNKIIRNISFGGRWLDIYDYPAWDFSMVTMKDNVIGDEKICRRRKKDQTGWDPYYLDIDTKDGYVLLTRDDPTVRTEFKGNTFVDGDPGFVDAPRKNFRLKSGSVAFSLGFKPIPIDSIGLRVDAFRRSIPGRPEAPAH
jgi:hypothetical protein